MYVCARGKTRQAGRAAGGGTKDVLLSQPQGSRDAREQQHLDQPANGELGSRDPDRCPTHTLSQKEDLVISVETPSRFAGKQR